MSSAGFIDSHSAAITNGASVVIGRKGSIGTVFYCPEPVYPIDTTFYVEPNDHIDIRYAFYLLSSLPLKSMDTDAAVPGLNRENAERLPVSIPPLTIQKSIVDVLGTIDDLIENNRRRIELLESMARAIYREWFVHFRFPGHEDVPLVDSDLGPIPEGWAVKLLDEITAQLPVGKRYDSKSSLPTGQVPILDQSVGGVMGYHNEVPGVRASLTSPVFTFANHTCAMRLMYEPFSVIQNVFPKVGRDGVATTLFAYHVGKDRQVIEDYKGHHPRWRETAVVSAPLAIQNQFTATIVPLHQRAEYISRSNATLITMRDLLLPKLVSGEIDVSDLDIDLSELDLVS